MGKRNCVILLVVSFLVIAWPVILFEQPTERVLPFRVGEQRSYLPITKYFVSNWPKIDLVNYSSREISPDGAAMTPGYFLLMTVVHFFTAGNLTALRLVNSAIGLAVVLFLFAGLSKRLPAHFALCLTLPLLASPLVIGPSIWLNTDNLALLFVILTMNLLIADNAKQPLAISAFSTLAIWTRQNTVWTLVPIGLQTLKEMIAKRQGLAPSIPWLWILSIIPPLASICTFLLLWGRLSPPDPLVPQAQLRFSGIPFLLAIFGTFSVFYASLIWKTRTLKLPHWFLALPALTGFLLAAICPTTTDASAGRTGGWLWELTKITPSIGDCSILIALLSAVGALSLFLLVAHAWQQGFKAEVVLLLASLVAYTATSVLCYNLYQRYLQPTAFLLFTWLIALTTVLPLKKWAYAGPVLFTLFNLAQTMAEIHARIFWKDLEII